MPRAFSLPQIRDLARGQATYLRAQAARAPGSGFGYPQLGWRYGALEAYHSAGRSDESMSGWLAERLEVGVLNSAWKAARIADIDRVLKARYVPRDRLSALEFRETLFQRRPPARGWQGHLILMPLGLAFETDDGPLLRLVLTEKGLSLRNPGTPTVLAAVLAFALSGPAGAWAPAIIEVFHLRDADYRRFPADELMTRWPRLSQLLTWAEGTSQSPAA
jgi:hypothetical protein